MNKRAKIDSLHIILIFLAIVLIVVLFWIISQNRSIDTDGDGLSDEKEIKLGTNITNPNTDGDRYLDGEDKEPLKVNSAKIVLSIINEKKDYHVFTLSKDTLLLGLSTSAIIGCGSLTFGACAAKSIPLLDTIDKSLDDTIYSSTGDIIISNIGYDYTEYLNYDIVYKIGGETLKVEQISAGRIDAQNRKTLSYVHDIKMKEIKYIVWDMLVKKQNIELSIENVNYKKYENI